MKATLEFNLLNREEKDMFTHCGNAWSYHEAIKAINRTIHSYSGDDALPHIKAEIERIIIKYKIDLTL